jgi:hypothetical protein
MRFELLVTLTVRDMYVCRPHAKEVRVGVIFNIRGIEVVLN